MIILEKRLARAKEKARKFFFEKKLLIVLFQSVPPESSKTQKSFASHFKKEVVFYLLKRYLPDFHKARQCSVARAQPSGFALSGGNRCLVNEAGFQGNADFGGQAL